MFSFPFVLFLCDSRKAANSASQKKREKKRQRRRRRAKEFFWVKNGNNFCEWHIKHGESGKREKDKKRKASHQANILNFIVMRTFKHENRKLSLVTFSSLHKYPDGDGTGNGKLNCFANNQLLILSSCEILFGEVNEY